MSGESDCAEAPEESKFCFQRTQPTSKCECSEANNYRKNSREKSKYRKGRYEFKQKGKWGYFSMPYNGHHVLPVQAAKALGTHKDQFVADAIKGVQWCVNNKKNMLAMPLWGHTIKHYCNVALGEGMTPDNILRDKAKAPPFQNMPMHDSDHSKNDGGFNAMALDKAEGIAARIKKSTDKHKMTPANIKTALNNLSDDLDEHLHDAGSTRQDGTHAAWVAGMKDEDGTSKWYEPFSMAQDGSETPRTFPCPRNGDIWEKIQKLANAFAAAK